MAGALYALALRSKGQGHKVITCSASMGLQVAMTAHFDDFTLNN